MTARLCSNTNAMGSGCPHMSGGRYSPPARSIGQDKRQPDEGDGEFA
jgi:hypothetical protein